MNTTFLLAAFVLLSLLAVSIDRANEEEIPAPEREFRGVWIASVTNIDWPSTRDLTTEQQKAELVNILDKAKQLNLNAVVLQVRPASDALYESKLEPWSEFLTGEMGKAPSPYYDPLAFAVEEAHKRGLEIHAWFNPYRARLISQRPVASNHISQTRPDLVKQYGNYLWLDPGEPDVQEHSLKVVMDVVKRYDIDGVHIDDYFYPYQITDAGKRLVDFPDDLSWQRYMAKGGKLERNDWRRENVNQFVERVYKAIKKEKKWVKFGISPFGIWRPGYPEQIRGLDAYDSLYADSRKWINNGWVDYFTPQLYFRIDQRAQSFPVLLKWWSEQNLMKRHLWAGQFTSLVGQARNPWKRDEIIEQIKITRAQEQISPGTIHFSMRSLVSNANGISDTLLANAYSKPALIPASPWLDNRAPAKPKLTQKQTELSWQPTGKEKPFWWVVYLKRGGGWTYEILPASQTTYSLDASVEAASVSAVDRCGNESQRAMIAVSGLRNAD